MAPDRVKVGQNDRSERIGSQSILDCDGSGQIGDKAPGVPVDRGYITGVRIDAYRGLYVQCKAGGRNALRK